MPQFAPVSWGPGRKEDFVSWIDQEIHQTQGDREDLERDWTNSLIQWRAKMPEDVLEFPYVGAANYEIGVTAMHHDPVLADMMQSFHASEDYWTPTAKRPDRYDLATALRRGLTAVEKRWLKMRQINVKAFIDNNILGTAVYKNRWHTESRERIRYDEQGAAQKQIRLLSHPAIDYVPLNRFWFPAYSFNTNPDLSGGTPWQAQEFKLSQAEFDAWAKGTQELPGFDKDAAEKARTQLTDRRDLLEEELRKEDDFEPFKDLTIRIFEIWARFDIKGDGVISDVVVTYCYETREILRAIHNPNAHGAWPFHVINYIPGKGIYGIGLAEKDEWAQDAATDIFNATVDNMRLANTRMFVAPFGSNVQPGESIYPGKTWFVDPGEQIGELRLSDVYPSAFQTLTQTLQLAELSSGVNDLRQGNISALPSRTPATSLLSMLQEGNKRFDMIHAGIRDVHSELGMRMTQNLAQRAQEDPQTWAGFFTRALGDEDAKKIMQVLLRGDEELEESFGIEVSATSASVNKEAEKQNYIAMLQVTSQIYQQLVQTAMMMAQVQDPVVQETAKAAYAQGVELLKQLLQRFDVQNPEATMGNLTQVVQAMQGQGGPGGGMMQPQGLPMGQGVQPGAGPLAQQQLAQLLGLGG